MRFFSIEKDKVFNWQDYKREYQIFEFKIIHKEFEPAIAEVVLTEKIDSSDLRNFFILIDRNQKPIFIGRCKPKNNLSKNLYLFEAAPEDEENQANEIKKSLPSFEDKFLEKQPIYYRASDLRLVHILSSDRSIAKVASKDNIYTHSIFENDLPNYQVNLILDSSSVMQTKVSANDQVFGDDGIECANPDELIKNWSRQIQPSIVSESTQFVVEKGVFKKDGDAYFREYKMKGNLEFKVNYECRRKEIVELNIKNSDSSNVEVFNLPIDVTDYIVDSIKWQEGVQYRYGDLVVFLVEQNAIFALCIEDHQSSSENFCSTEFWRIGEQREFFDINDFSLFSRIGKDILSSVSRYLKIYLRLNHPKKTIEFKGPLDAWSDLDIGSNISFNIDEHDYSCVVIEYKKFSKYNDSYAFIKCISLDDFVDKSAIAEWESVYGSSIEVGGIRLTKKGEIFDSKMFFDSNKCIDVQKVPNRTRITVGNGSILISEKLIRLRGYLVDSDEKGSLI